MKEKFKSRKFWLAQEVILLSVLVPLLYKAVGIAEGVTLVTLGVLSGAGALYGVVNTVDKKLNGRDGL